MAWKFICSKKTSLFLALALAKSILKANLIFEDFQGLI